ncbi:hypothetical protein GWI33_014787, partial [Rhynchophorus ferrugineus]
MTSFCSKTPVSVPGQTNPSISTAIIKKDRRNNIEEGLLVDGRDRNGSEWPKEGMHLFQESHNQRSWERIKGESGGTKALNTEYKNAKKIFEKYNRTKHEG